MNNINFKANLNIILTNYEDLKHFWITINIF